MEIQQIVGLAVTAGSTVIVPLVVQAMRGRGSKRAAIKSDAELLRLLPKGQAKTKLEQHLERSVIDLIDAEQKLRRDPTGIVLAVIFLLGGCAVVYFAWTAQGWWHVPWIAAAVFLFTFGGVGLSESAVRRQRDEKGHSIDK